MTNDSLRGLENQYIVYTTKTVFYVLKGVLDGYL